ncbi:hypothetical protein MOQ72_01530 [Saccharopolyspora sp. K220]|uniref:hypothetical protein n=1 Tax=Saccharopolyspora soli TaxID=2926618 RepID=UPI001F5AB55E|nr:hypothetical protein [Saccharopolyspora soli]MCI2416092.1 hypothetical protein [Saccharopolyspora soli]
MPDDRGDALRRPPPAAFARERPILSAPGLTGDQIQQLRSNWVIANLYRLRAPLAQLELNSQEHSALARIAAHDVEFVNTVASLLARARAAAPLNEPTQPDR